METLIISLPVELKKFLDGKIAKGEYKNYSDYMEQNLSKNMLQEEWRVYLTIVKLHQSFEMHLEV